MRREFLPSDAIFSTYTLRYSIYGRYILHGLHSSSVYKTRKPCFFPSIFIPFSFTLVSHHHFIAWQFVRSASYVIRVKHMRWHAHCDTHAYNRTCVYTYTYAHRRSTHRVSSNVTRTPGHTPGKSSS